MPGLWKEDYKEEKGAWLCWNPVWCLLGTILIAWISDSGECVSLHEGASLLALSRQLMDQGSAERLVTSPKKYHHYLKASPDCALKICVIVPAMPDKSCPWHARICSARGQSASVFFGLLDAPFWALKSTKIFLDASDNQAGYSSCLWSPACICCGKGNFLYLGW